jgi:hypothetical protein
MGVVAKCAVVWALLVASVAHADPVDDLVAKGQELAKRLEFTQAIAAFKQADAQRPRALHACLIGLAYTRRELWPQAELFFAQCRTRATAGDPAPTWAAEAEHQLTAKLAAANIPAITIVVRPPRATLAASSFEADEVFPPGVIHLAPGRHQIEARADGYTPQSRDVTVVAGQPQTIEIELAELPHPKPPSSTLPWIVAGGGVALVGAGVAVDLLVLQPLNDDLAKSRFLHAAKSGEFDRAREVTVGLWAAGAIAIGVGAYLGMRHREVAVSAALDRSGGMIVVGWQR